MARKTSKKPEINTYREFPQVPQDFEGAAAVNLEAEKGIKFWKEQKAAAMFESQVSEASIHLKKWQEISRQAKEVMQSYQLRLF